MGRISRRGASPRLLLLIVCALVLLVASCGTDPDTVAPEPGEEAAPTEEETPAPGTPQQGGRLVIGITAELTGFDHSRDSAPTPGSAGLFGEVFETLVSPAADGSHAPMLAESLESNEDATVWTAVLRDGILFQDGTPFDAEAVKFNLERMEESLPTGRLESVDVVDERTVEIRLTQAWGAFPDTLASQRGFMSSPSAVEELGDDYSDNPVGTGPFRLVEWVRGSHLRFERNEDYWRDGYPLLDEVEYRIIPDPDARVAALQAGDIDAAELDGLAALDLPAELVRRSDSAGVHLIYLNGREPPLDDIRVRQALAHALDREAIAETVWRGSAQVQDSPTGPDHPFYEPIDYPEFDPDRARELLEDYGEPVSFELFFSVDPVQQLVAQLAQEMWQDVGIDVQLGAPAEAGAHSDRVVFQEFEAAVFTFGAFLDPDTWWSAIWHSGGALWVTGIGSPEIDEALDRAGASPDLDERIEQYAIVHHELAEHLPALFLASREAVEAAQPHVQGIGEYEAPDGTLLPWGHWYRIPFTAASMWRSDD